MTTGLTYTTYKTQIATMAVVEETDPAFVTILPQMLTYAENRIYRDLDFMFTSTSVQGYQFTAGNRQLTIPYNLADGSGNFVVSEQINVITPLGTSNPNVGTRTPLLATTKEFLDAVYGASTYTGVPKYFVPFNDNLFLVGPFPDASYFVEVVGTYRPVSLSATSAWNGAAGTTFISTYLPETLIMASMVYISAYQRNFGRMNDDPQMAQSYEGQYQALIKTAMSEENRKKFESAAWSSQANATTATPSRG
jgi:hypothetical protein